MRRAVFVVVLLLGAAIWAEPPGEADRGVDVDLLEQVRKGFDAAPGSSQAASTLKELLEQKLPGEEAEWPPVFQAYQAALEGLAGKHSRLPWDKYNRTKAGLAKLNPLAEAYPESIEIRMLRFSFCIHLPEFFEMGPQVELDRVALVDRLVRGTDSAVSGEYRKALIGWILRNGKPTEEQRTRLQAALEEKERLLQNSVLQEQ